MKIPKTNLDLILMAAVVSAFVITSCSNVPNAELLRQTGNINSSVTPEPSKKPVIKADPEDLAVIKEGSMVVKPKKG